MSDKTILALPGRKLSVPRVFKRTMQISMVVVLTAVLVLAFVVANSMLIGRGGPMQAVSAWLAFIQRPDIQASVILTAIVSVLFIYWQRDRERK